MKINGLDPEIYGAYLLSYSVSGCELENTYFLPPSTLIPIRLTNRARLRKITLKFDFHGQDTHDAIRNMSNFTATLHNEAELLLPDGFYYYCVLVSTGTSVTKADWIEQNSFSLIGFRHGPLESYIFTETSDIFVNGNYETECRFIINTEKDSITVNGISINNISGEIIIDGIKKVVLQNGANKFIDCDMTDFPKLNPGNNTISITEGATVIVQYYPIYL